MFQLHTHIYTTFHPADRAKAIKIAAALASSHPDRVFQGRHETSVPARLAEALSSSTLTLVFESDKTCRSSEVQNDIKASLAKTPPNQILRILLPEEEAMSGNTALSKSLVDMGVEVVSCDDTIVEEALVRLDLLARYEPKLRNSAANKVAPGGCTR